MTVSPSRAGRPRRAALAAALAAMLAVGPGGAAAARAQPLPSAPPQYPVGGPSDRIEGTSVFLSDAEIEKLLQQASDLRQQAIDAADRCDAEGKQRAVDHLQDKLRYITDSMAKTADLMRRMALQLQQILEQLAEFIPSGDPNAPALGAAQGALEGWATEAAGLAVGEVGTSLPPGFGQAVSGIKTLQGVADDIAKMEKGTRILEEAKAQYRAIQDAQRSLDRWKFVHEIVLQHFEIAATYPVQPCGEGEGSASGTGTIPGTGTTESPPQPPPTGPTSLPPVIDVASDPTEWCEYDPGGTTTTTPTPTDPGGPGGGPPGTPAPTTPGGPGPTSPGGTPPPQPGDGPGGQDDPGDGGGPDDPGTPGDPPTGPGPTPPGTTPGGTAPPPDRPQDGDDEDEEDDDEQDGATVTIYVKAKQDVLHATGQPVGGATPGQQIKILADSTRDVALPGPGAPKPQTDHAADPIQGTTDANGDLALDVPASALGLALGPGSPRHYALQVDAESVGSRNLEFTGTTPEAAVGALPGHLQGFVTSAVAIGSSVFVTVTYPKAQEALVLGLVDQTQNLVSVEINVCRDKQAGPDDPYFRSAGSWDQEHDDQWAIKRIGFTAGRDSAWEKLGPDPRPVTVAVIDTGLDWNHLDLAWESLWRNPDETPGNGVDDDGNGYVDDVIGWDFLAGHNRPWDHDGHGTIVAGLIAADRDNGVGIAGINPHARIMVLKALDAFGHTRASNLARAIVYAADEGARIVNLSVGGRKLTRIEREAVDYAHDEGVLVIVAAGNEGIDVSGFGPAGLPNVLTVASTGFEDERVSFSNWGTPIDLAAPGLDVLSLRARRTDTMREIPGVDYVPGFNYVGPDKRYYRASGTSFSAPLVAGVASLLWSKHPELSSEEVQRMLLQSAEDVETPGRDRYTGYGLVDARRALEIDPQFFVEAEIHGVRVVQEDGAQHVRVLGTADADRFEGARIELGAGEKPESWRTVVEEVDGPVRGGALGDIAAEELGGSAVWMLRLVTEHESGRRREARYLLRLGPG